MYDNDEIMKAYQTINEDVDVNINVVVSDEEQQDDTYDYSCVMCMAPFSLKCKIVDIVNSIPTEALHSYGKDYEPHVTGLFGIHSCDFDEIKSAISDLNPFVRFKIIGLSLFENEDFDVLKFDIESPDMCELNCKLKTLDHTNNYPDYHPHLTIAYLKPGMGKQFIHPTELDNTWHSSDQFKASFANCHDVKFFTLHDQCTTTLTESVTQDSNDLIDEDCRKCADGIYIVENYSTVKCNTCDFVTDRFELKDGFF